MQEAIQMLEELMDCLRREVPKAKKCVDLVLKIANGSERNPREACSLLVLEIMREDE